MSQQKKVLEEVPVDKIPEWLNNDFFVEVFEKLYKKNRSEFKVKIVSIKPAVGAGENYISGLYRVKVDGTQDNDTTTTHSFIVKFFIEAFPGIEEMGMFEKETQMYRDVLPEFEREYARVGESIRFAPICFKVADTPVDILVFEDLSPRGYKVADRLNGLDLKHFELFLTQLAQMHAASAVCYEKNGPYAGRLSAPMHPEHMEGKFREWVESGFEHYLNGLRSSEILAPLVDTIEKWPTNFFAQLTRYANAQPNAFNVLNHGDAWVNNYLFSYDHDGSPNDIKFIDFQGASWGPPIVDLYFAFITSTKHEYKKTHFDYFIQVYHTELAKNLAKLGYPKQIPSLKELHIQLLESGFYGAFSTCMIMPLVLLDPREDANLSTLTDETGAGDGMKRDMYLSPRYIRALEVLLPFFAKRGAIDSEL